MRYEFEKMEFRAANEATDAFRAALKAMAYFGTGDEHMLVVAEMMIAAEKQSADRFREKEMGLGVK